MNKTVGISSILVLTFLLQVGSAIADSAWWELCPSCDTEDEYRIAAISASGDDEIVYVSNPELLETKKFNRFSTWEDFGTGMVLMTHVTEAELTGRERDAFRDALEKSQTVFATIDAELVNAFAGVPPFSSALFSIRGGRLGNSFFFGLQAAINSRGLLPTRESVGASAGVNIRGVGSGNLGLNDAVRVVPLALRVQYSDGSHINAVYNPDGTWSDVSVVDAEGNTIDIDTDSSLNSVVVASVVGDYIFAGESIEDAINDFVQAVGLSRRPGVGGCTWQELPNGDFLLNCSRT